MSPEFKELLEQLEADQFEYWDPDTGTTDTTRIDGLQSKVDCLAKLVLLLARSEAAQ